MPLVDRYWDWHVGTSGPLITAVNARLQSWIPEHKKKRDAFDPGYKIQKYQRLAQERQDLAAKQPETSEWYCYTPLQSRQIRLLHLEPGSKDDVLKFSLSIHSLDDDDLEYDALSYTWGDAANMPSVSCDGKLIEVTRNLFNALQKIRHQDAPRTLWIDAVCINQGDIAERGFQVQLMRDIYQKARCVIVWLGGATKDSTGAFELIHKLYAIALKTSPEDADKPITESDLKTLGLPDKKSSVWVAIGALYWRPWFTRVWIIQEIALASTAFVWCGDSGIHWNGFVDVSQLLHRRRFGRLMELDVSPILGLNFITSQVQSEQKPGLATLIASTRRNFATNPADYIYSLLGISSETSIVPDYTVPVVDTYREVTKSLLLQSLDILSLASDVSWNHVDGLPSWVPDWSSYQRTYSLIHARGSAQGRTQRACGDTEPKIRFSPDGKTLWVEGVLLDQVRVTGETYIEAKSDSLWTRYVGKELANMGTEMAVSRTLRTWEQMILKLKTYPTGEDIRSVLRRTFVAGHTVTVAEAPDVTMEELYQAFRRHWMDFPGESKNPGRFTAEQSRLNSSTYTSSVTAAAYGRRVFVTEKGYTGLGPHSTKPGDSVVVFSGGKTAFVLRQLSDNPHVYHFIGEAYAHGWMDGEGFAEKPKIEEFEIV